MSKSLKTISISNIEFQYPNMKVPILKIDQFDLEPGEKVFLYGPSGCGKTTFLEVLAGVLCPQQGHLQILGKDFLTFSSSQRDHFRATHMGYIFQSFNLIPYLSVLENIVLPLQLSHERRQKISPKNEFEEARLLCERLGIVDLLTKKVTELSVGQQQRVSVARALLGAPEIILADEPTSSLDSDHREKFIKLLFEVSNLAKSTVLFVSHDKSLQPLFDRAISLPAINSALSGKEGTIL